MADVTAPVSAAPASPKAKKAKSPRKPKAAGTAKPKVASSHPTFAVMIQKAVSELKEKKGSSRAAILKYILQHYKVGGNIIQVNSHIRQALKRGVTSGALKQVKGVGASGSFRIGDKAVKKPKAKKVTKKPAAKKPKTAKASPKKVAGTAKPKVAKKAAKKPKSPKKAKAASPKKTKAAKPKTAKKPAAKKSSPKKKVATKKAAAPATVKA